MSSGTLRPKWATPTRLVVLSFALVIMIGTILLMLPVSSKSGASPRLIDAFFTAASAVCVTGLAVVNTAEFWSTFGQAVILALIQIGGLGLMIFATMHALVTGRRIGLRERMLLQEQTGQSRLSGLVSLAKRVIVATLVFELIGAVILGTVIGRTRNLSFAESFFQGVFHSVSAFCNAGFDILGDNLMGFQSNATVILTVSLLIIFGGIGFHVLVDLYVNRFRWNSLSLHSRLALRMSIILLVVGTVAFGALEWNNPGTLGPQGLKGKVLSAWFQSVTPRTAGFNSILEENLWAPAAFLTVILMFIGASPGGTGGGIKTTTFAVVARMVRASVEGGHDVTLEKRRLPQDVVSKAVAILLLALALVVASTMIVSGIEQKPFLDILFEVTSAFGTVGLSRGLTPTLSEASKLVLICTMFTGRVGPLSLAIALSRQRGNGGVRYPEERVTVG
ncbi:MAG: TrkH family potassium uptake protein [Bacillota bacterium]